MDESFTLDLTSSLILTFQNVNLFNLGGLHQFREVHGNIVDNLEDEADWASFEGFLKGSEQAGGKLPVVLAGFNGFTSDFHEAADTLDLISEGVSGEVSDKDVHSLTPGDKGSDAGVDFRVIKGLIKANSAEETGEVFRGEFFLVEGNVLAVVE